jgi:hypothetical protein
MNIVRLLCVASMLLLVAGTLAWQVKPVLSCALFLAMVACFVGACRVKVES